MSALRVYLYGGQPPAKYTNGQMYDYDKEAPLKEIREQLRDEWIVFLTCLPNDFLEERTRKNVTQKTKDSVTFKIKL